jgi:hypothetical protein
MLNIQEPSIQQIANVISQVTGPAFLLAAEAQLLDVLIGRLDRILDRAETLEMLDPEDARAGLKAELPVLKKRAHLIHTSISWGVSSCVVTSLLVIMSFVAAFLRFQHEYGAASMFTLAMILFTAALIAFGREVRLAYSQIESTMFTLQKRAGK